ncbi:MAG: enoyl-ACP reductase [Desulfovibrio sp.]|jgi:enoyl-[acyl-carrier protein] reductase I|nr:enoyl-ACP reductase [Desulfovibrio sp.]
MLLSGKKAVICGIANNRSIAYGIAKVFRDNGAEIALSWPGEALRRRVEPIAEELGAAFTFPCDVTKDDELVAAAETVRNRWDTTDILVHAVAFANRDDLQGRYIDTSRDGFSLALDVSAFSLVGLCRAFESVFHDGASVITLSYYGAQKHITNYNVMGVAKAALEASVRYLAYDLGQRGIRINAISAGPIKTLAASGISGFGKILNHIAAYTPMKKNIDIGDVGNAALFLASPLASGVTGDILFVDAGYHTSGIQIAAGDAE